MALKKSKADEFYTLYKDIESEISHYKDKLKGKIVYCNCDDPDKSNFAKYFINNFKDLELGGLYITYLSDDWSPFATHIDETGTLTKYPLAWTGSFESKECVDIMKKSDVVITNPPFSLFRNFIDIVLALKKDYILISNLNIITYPPVFNEFKHGRMSLGYGFKDYAGYFYSNYVNRTKIAVRPGQIRVSGICWLTSLRDEQPDPIKLTCKYTPEKYPKYDLYDAINVSKLKEIPYDYDGVMGVPITIFGKLNRDQFEILGLDVIEHGDRMCIDGDILYARVLIKNKKVIK